MEKWPSRNRTTGCCGSASVCVHTGGGEHVGQHSKKILSNQLRQGA